MAKCISADLTILNNSLSKIKLWPYPDWNHKNYVTKLDFGADKKKLTYAVWLHFFCLAGRWDAHKVMEPNWK